MLRKDAPVWRKGHFGGKTARPEVQARAGGVLIRSEAKGEGRFCFEGRQCYVRSLVCWIYEAGG